MSGILQALLQGGKSGGSLVLFDKIVATPNAKALRYGDNEQLTKSAYPLGYAEVVKLKEASSKGNIFTKTKSIENVLDYAVVDGVEYIITSDNKVKYWGKATPESETEEWLTIETFNRVGPKMIVSGTKIVFMYDDDDFGAAGIVVIDTITKTATKVALFTLTGDIWINNREALFLVGDYISFINNTAIPIADLTLEALVVTAKQSRAFWKNKFWATDNMNLFVATTITGEYSSVSGIDRPKHMIPISADELFVNCTSAGNNKNYIYDETTFTEKTSKEMELICSKDSGIYGFDGTTILSSTDKGITWQVSDLGNTVKSIGCAGTDIVAVDTTGLFSRTYGLLTYQDTITLTDTSTITINYYKNGEIKICLPEEQTNLNTVFADKGVLDYFVFDSVNEYFKIPRANLPEAFSSIGLQKCWYIN